MIPELGHFALILALAIALVQGSAAASSARRGASRDWIALARPAAQGQFVFVAIAFGCLAWSFFSNDFSVLYVASNSNSQPARGLPHRRRLGRPRRLAAAVGADAGGLDAGGRACSAAACPRTWWRASSA